MLHGCINGAASAIYSILNAAREQYGIYCPGADILQGENLSSAIVLLATHTMCDLYFPRPKKRKG